MKRLTVFALFAASAVFPLALFAQSGPEKGEVEQLVAGSLYKFTFSRLDNSTLASKIVFEDNLKYFLETHKDLRVRDLTPILGVAESRCAVPGLPVPGRTTGYWVWTREALPNEPQQSVKFYAYKPGLVDRGLFFMKIFPDLARRIVVAPLNAGDSGSLSGYYVIYTGDQPENSAAN